MGYPRRESSTRRAASASGRWIDRRNNLTLVTRNVSDFINLGLQILNPWLEQ
jgi:hypothetical protein